MVLTRWAGAVCLWGMRIDNAEFWTSAKGLEDCPPSRQPEVAFIGRSNVGKSSLVNMLTKQKELAKVSKMPGKTKLINFFKMDDRWTLVDLPGYGFAKVAKGQQRGFNFAVGDYLQGRSNLKLILILVDSRFEPMEIDLEFIAWMQACEVPQALVFTKTDEVSASKWERHVAIYEETLSALELPAYDMIPCSSKDRAGRGALLNYIDGYLPKKSGKKGSRSGVSLRWMK